MEIYTSYFYQIRFFKPNMIPVSTAIWDPKWYHQFKGQDFVFKDKNNVYNGVRYEPLHPGPTCDNLCRGKPCEFSPENCLFLQRYREQLESLDFDKVMNYFERLCNRYKELNGEDAIIVLMVHEAPDNECSERRVLLEWLNNHGVQAKELDYPINGK